MEQQQLRNWEERCIQEEPPFCQAACPIHVDVRAFLKFMAKGDAAGARNILERTMPLPGVLGLLCDHPCEEKCRRGDVEESIRIGELERACIRNSTFKGQLRPLPLKGKSAAVVGGSLSSLTVAWDLGKKGYAVSLFCDEPGGSLLLLTEERLSRQALKQEIERLAQLRVKILSGLRFDSKSLKGLIQDFDAVYIGFDEVDSPTAAEFGLEMMEDGSPTRDPLSLETSHAGVFAGGIQQSGSFFPMTCAFEGRKAAASMDRYVTGVSMTASRDKEGPFETRLFTSIKGVEPKPAIRPADDEGYTLEDAVAEAKRCLQCECMECVKVCAYLERHKGYPKKYAREIYNNLSVIHGLRQANKLINSCSYCGLCETVCPNNFAMADLCAAARAEMVETNKMPLSAHDFALRDMAFNTSEAASLVLGETDSNHGAYLFFPGCQLAGASPNHVLLTLTYLREKLSDGVGIMLHCCGAPADWAARQDLFDPVLQHIRSAWEERGKPTLILACPTCGASFRDNLPDIKTISLWEVLHNIGLPPNAEAPTKIHALHDPCTARDQPQVLEAVRDILSTLQAYVEELELSKEKTLCCGYGGLMEAATPEMGREFALRRAGQSEADYLAYCAMCRDSLSRAGKSVAHLLDFIFPSSPDAQQPTSPEPYVRKGPGTADRHENRARLKRTLLLQTDREPPVQEKWESLDITVVSEVQAAVDRRRILAEDLKQTIHEAEENGRYIIDDESGKRTAFLKSAAVTFWVEYTPMGERRYNVHRAWFHRMHIKGMRS